MILKVGKGHTSKLHTYDSYGVQQHCEFRNEAWDKNMKIWNSYTGLTHAIEPYLLTITEIFSVMTTFEIIYHQKFGVEEYATPHVYQKFR